MSAAPKPKLVVSSPTSKPMLPGKIRVSASLVVSKRAEIRVARFFVNGRRVTVDRVRPFIVKRGVKFDTRKLRRKKRPFVTIVVKYDVVKPSGLITRKKLTKRVRLRFDPGHVGAQGAKPPFGYPLAFSEDFDGVALDTTRWNDQRYDSLDQEVAGTPALSRPFNIAEGAAYGKDNVSVGGGALSLTLEDTRAPGYEGPLERSTGMVNTKDRFSFKYGYVETRAWVSDCEGCWPTFWILPAAEGAWPPEIDIFEYINLTIYSKKYPHSVFHWAPDGPDGDHQYEHHPEAGDAPSPLQEWMVTRPAGESGNFMGQWHTYGMLWTPDYVEIYFDGKLGARVNGASKLPQQAMYLIYQMAICRTDGPECTAEASTPPAGSKMMVDYLHVYSFDAHTGSGPTIPSGPTGGTGGTGATGS
ncbi:MAG: glycoside hydrolase family 16 protein [Solirubrobacterales bacterium]